MLWMEAQHTKHVTYQLASHFVWCTTYRKKILVGKLATFIEEVIRRICEANTWTIGTLKVQEDHVHLFLSAPPSVAPSRITHTLKGVLAARQWYFADIYGEGGRAPGEPQHATQLTSEEVLRLIVQPNEQGRYPFDEMGFENLPEHLGYLVG
jgi:REP element-mobilizing transposase RayT